MDSGRETLAVTVERVCYPVTPERAEALKPKAEWYILRTSRGTAKGTMPWRPQEGERLELEGRWEAYRGQREFRFVSARPDVPVDPRDALHYACERTLGIGPSLEQAIWDTAGEKWAEIQSGDVRLLTDRVLARLRETVAMMKREAEMSEAMAWLLGKGCTMAMAGAAWERWGVQTVGMVQADCYVLCDLHGYGFCHVDRSVRHMFGIGDGDFRRVRAAVLYAMGLLTADGGTVVAWEALRDRVNAELGGSYTVAVAGCVRGMFGTGALFAFPEAASLATGTDYENEMAVWEFCRGA